MNARVLFSFLNMIHSLPIDLKKQLECRPRKLQIRIYIYQTSNKDRLVRSKILIIRLTLERVDAFFEKMLEAIDLVKPKLV